MPFSYLQLLYSVCHLGHRQVFSDYNCHVADRQGNMFSSNVFSLFTHVTDKVRITKNCFHKTNFNITALCHLKYWSLSTYLVSL